VEVDCQYMFGAAIESLVEPPLVEVVQYMCNLGSELLVELRAAAGLAVDIVVDAIVELVSVVAAVVVVADNDHHVAELVLDTVACHMSVELLHPLEVVEELADPPGHRTLRQLTTVDFHLFDLSLLVVRQASAQISRDYKMPPPEAPSLALALAPGVVAIARTRLVHQLCSLLDYAAAFAELWEHMRPWLAFGTGPQAVAASKCSS
jgi:hypothetical protein